MVVLFFFIGLGLLIFGAEILVRGASRLAGTFGVPPLVIGLTVVAFATSSPEFAVSLGSLFQEQQGMALGTIVGSNISNILLILGVSALLSPLMITRQLLRLDVPVVIILSLVVYLFALDLEFSRLEGGLLFVGLVVYIWYMIRMSRRQGATEEYEEEYGNNEKISQHWGRSLVLVLLGLGMLVLGSRWLVDSAVTIAHHFGVSDLVIGLTIVAIGTSSPELVTSVVAALRGERNMAVGNVIGSNIFNLMGVLGLTSLLSPAGMAISSGVVGFDLPVMVVTAFACLPIFFTGTEMSRKEGVLFLGYYIAYLLYLILAASQHDVLPRFNLVMGYFVVPLTVIVITVVVWREIVRRRDRIY